MRLLQLVVAVSLTMAALVAPEVAVSATEPDIPPGVSVTASVTAPAAAILGPDPDPAGDRIVTVTATDDGALTVDTVDTTNPAEAAHTITRAQQTPGVVAVTVDSRTRLADSTSGPVTDTTPDTGNPAVDAAKHASAAAGGAAAAITPTAVCPDYSGYQWHGGRMGWGYGEPADSVTVAVIDTGTDATHPDLTGRVIPGKDYVDPTRDGTWDGHGHGTHVAGIISAVKEDWDDWDGVNDSCGIDGMSTATILPVRVLGNDGSGWDSDVTAGIIWAADNGAEIINASIGGSQWNPAGQAAIDYARAKGVAVIAAAGNWRALGSPPSFPAAYIGATSVAATELGGSATAFSNRGDYVDVAAFGISVLSTLPGGNWGYMSGTSQAAPHIAGAAAATLHKQRANPADPANGMLCSYGGCGINPTMTGEQAALHVIGAGERRHCTQLANGTTTPRGWNPDEGWGVPFSERVLYPTFSTTTCAGPSTYLLPQPADLYTEVPPLPTAPVNAVATNPASHTVAVTWAPPYYHGTSALTGYTATATPTTGDGPARTCTADPDATNCNVVGLTNGIPHTVTVTATNPHGTGPHTFALGDTAFGDTITPVGVPDPVINVAAAPSATNPYQLTVTWNRPADVGGGWISEYQVTAVADDGTRGSCGYLTFDSLITTCTTKNLPNVAKTYTVTIIATNYYGPSAPSTPITATTGPPPAPQGVLALGNDRTIAVSWTPPALPHPGTISGYRVTATSPDGAPAGGCTGTKDATGCTITNLTNGVTYTVHVYTLTPTATSAPATTSATPRVTAGDPGAPPAAPTLVNATPGSTRADVSWQAAATAPGNSSPFSYTATATSADGTHTRSCTTDLLTTHCTITKLNNGTVYAIKVTARNPAGDSPPAAGPRVVPALTADNLPTKVVAGNTYRLATGKPNATLFANVTVTEAEDASWLTTYPCLDGRPWASSHNYVPGQSRAVYTVVKADSEGDVCIYSNGTTHLVWDQGGDTLRSGGTLSPVAAHTPVRKYDSRTIGAGARLPGGATVTVKAGAPGDTIVGHVTVTAPTGSGFITAYPCAAGRPWTSNLNFATGQTLPNLVSVKADSNGNICLYTTTSTHLIWDQSAETAALDSHTPVRKLDTREPSGGTAKVPGNTVRRIRVGTAGVQVFGNLTVVAPESGGYTTVYRCGDPRPTASNSNYLPGATVANFATARADSNGDICVYTTATTHMIWDQSGTEPEASSDVNLYGSPQRLLDSRLAAR